MAKSRVPLHGKPQGYVLVDTGATVGATIGVDLRWPSGAVATEDELRAAATPPDTGQTFTYWRLIQEIPPNVTALAQTQTTGLYVITGTGASATRAIRGEDGELVVADGDGVGGDPALGLADVPDAGGGTLQRFERDGKGRVSGTSEATTDDLPEGEGSLYYTDARADDRAAAAVAAHVAAPDPHPQYLTRPDPTPAVTGSRGDGTALESLLAALVTAGLITDDTTA